MKIHVYMVCWNEEELLPFFFKHYESFADKIVAYDNMSHDRTREILDAHPLCERRDFDTGEQVRDDLLLELKNNAWKESRGHADWVIVCDADEFIYHPDLLAYLSSCQERGITIPQPTGFNMVSDDWPEPDRQIWEQVREGRLDLFFSKKAVFDPNAIIEINYKPGAHLCSPTGRIKEERDPNLKLLHYKYIGGAGRLKDRRARFSQRLSQVNKKFGWGTQADSYDALTEYNYEKSLATPLNLDYQIPTPEAQRKRVLFIAGTGGFPDRLAGLAHTLDPAKYEVHLAYDLNDDDTPVNLPFNVAPVTSISSTKAQEATARGAPLFDEDTLEKLAWEDIRIIRELSPEMVVGDMRQSLSISTRLTNTIYVNVINAQWSPFARLPLELMCNPLAPLLGEPLANLALNAVAPFCFAPHVAPHNFARRKFRLPLLHWDIKRVYSFGDYTIYPDVPQLVPTQDLPASHRYIGPILWSPPIPLPDWWHELPLDKPIIYLNLVSTGQHKLLTAVLAALDQLPVTVIAANASASPLDACPPNVFVAKHLPVREAAKRSHLVICNGGNMFTQQALACGAPVLALVSNIDQLAFARAVSNYGAGEVLREGEAEVAAVKRVVWRMLEGHGYRESAQRIAQVYEQMNATQTFPAFIEEIGSLVGFKAKVF